MLKHLIIKLINLLKKSGNLLYNLGNFNEAIAMYDCALEINPNYADADAKKVE